MPRNDLHRGKKGVTTLRRLQAFDLYKGGATYRQIAEQTGVSVAVAHGDVQRVLGHLEALEGDAAREWRRTIIERDRGLILAAYPKALNGDWEAARLLVLIHRELRELLGLDPPKQVEGASDDFTATRFARYLAERSGNGHDRGAVH